MMRMKAGMGWEMGWVMGRVMGLVDELKEV